MTVEQRMLDIYWDYGNNGDWKEFAEIFRDSCANKTLEHLREMQAEIDRLNDNAREMVNIGTVKITKIETV